MAFQLLFRPLRLAIGNEGGVHGLASIPGGANGFSANPGIGSVRSRYLAAGVLLLALALAPLVPVAAASALLESVKQNPQLAKQLCAEFKQLNAAGQSATSPQSLARVASSQGLSTMDAEVLSTYVIGLYCPDVR
jgi:hypothetical protein